MLSGASSLFDNVNTYFSLLISIEYFKIVLLFVMFIFVLHILSKIIKQN